MTTIATILATYTLEGILDDAGVVAVCAFLGLTEPGGYALREPDGRLMIWASEDDSLDDDGARATYRSRGPITDTEWQAVCCLAWIESSVG